MKSLIRCLICFLALTLVSSTGAKVTVKLLGGVPAGCSYSELDFSGWTEVDTYSELSKTSGQITFTNYDRGNNDTGYIYTDYGAAYFDGDFEFRFIVQASGGQANFDSFAGWGVASQANQIEDWTDGIALELIHHSDGGADAYYFNLKLRENGGNGASDNSYGNTVSASTDYYVTCTRDDDGGSNSTGRTECVIRTTSHSGSIVDTVGVNSAAGEQNDYRYLHGATRTDPGATGKEIDGYVKTMGICE